MVSLAARAINRREVVKHIQHFESLDEQIPRE